MRFGLTCEKTRALTPKHRIPSNRFMGRKAAVAWLGMPVSTFTDSGVPFRDFGFEIPLTLTGRRPPSNHPLFKINRPAEFFQKIQLTLTGLIGNSHCFRPVT